MPDSAFTYRPVKGAHYSRRLFGWVFLGCAVLLAAVHVLAALPFLLIALIVFYYAPRWDLRVEIVPGAVCFSENVLETFPVELRFADLAEIRRVEELEDRKGLFTAYPEYRAYVEFETTTGRIYRMHDIFPDALDEKLASAAGSAVRVRLDGPGRDPQ